MANLKNTKINDTGFLQIPTGSIAQRPSSATNGEIRYNSELKYVEQYDVEYGLWFPAGFIPPVATGGTVTDITQSGVNYRVHTFTSDGAFDVVRGGVVDVLVVAGGGSGGASFSHSNSGAGGGGAGGLIYRPNKNISNQSYSITVGAGGSTFSGHNTGNNGNNSLFDNLLALGGGAGGGGNIPRFGNDGGSGGGSREDDSGQSIGLQPNQPGESGTFGFGNNGGLVDNSNFASGGGGAGEEPIPTSQANNNTPGGAGLYFGDKFTDNFGENGWFAGGGGTTNRNGSNQPGGIGGGGNGVGGPAQTNTGGGGGAGRHDTSGGAGGSGIVIVRYRIG